MEQYREGLIACGNGWGTSFCIVKSIQGLMSVIFIVIIIQEMIFRIYRERQFNFFVVVCLQMLISLLLNLFHAVWHTAWILTHLQQLFINLYFITIVYQVAVKLLKRYYRKDKKIWIVTHIFFGFFLIVMVVTFMLAIFVYFSDCQEVFYLIFDSVGIILSSILLAIGIKFNRNQMQKIKGIYNTQHVKNTLPYMWIWISINILGVIFSLVQALFFVINPEGSCLFTNNIILDDVLKLIFIFLTFHLGMLATIIFYHMKYQRFDRIQLEDTILQQVSTEFSRQNSIELKNGQVFQLCRQSRSSSRKSSD